MKLQKRHFVLIILFASFQICFGQTGKQPEFWDNEVFPSHWEFANVPDKEIIEIKRRWEEIGNSLRVTSNAFAGTYSKSGNRGYFLRWSPEKGFVYAYYYENLVLDASYGKVSSSESEVKFIVEREMQNSDASRKLITPTIWIPAYKGKYFLRREDLKIFGDFYGGFGDFNGFPRKWNCDCNAFYERVGKDIDDPKTKSFIVPAIYLKFIKTPISGKIIAVGRKYISKHLLSIGVAEKASITPVTVNLGRKNKISNGLLFLLEPDFDGTEQFLKIITVGEKSSKAVVVRELDETGKERFSKDRDESTNKKIYKAYPAVKPGTKIKTNSIESF